MAKFQNQIIGSFVFRNEGDGCLTAKYFESDSRQGPFTESCKLVGQPSLNSPFIGNYITSWIEEGNRIQNGILVIEESHDNQNLFSLRWFRDANESDLLFEGFAMRYENLLVGTYWN